MDSGLQGAWFSLSCSLLSEFLPPHRKVLCLCVCELHEGSQGLFWAPPWSPCTVGPQHACSPPRSPCTVGPPQALTERTNEKLHCSHLSFPPISPPHLPSLRRCPASGFRSYSWLRFPLTGWWDAAGVYPGFPKLFASPLCRHVCMLAPTHAQTRPLLSLLYL